MTAQETISISNDTGRPIAAPVPRPTAPAHIISGESEAIEVARKIAASFAVDAGIRDRERRLPLPELDLFSQSGLWGITVPKAYGGAGVSQVTLSQIISIIASADSSLSQIPQNHYEIVDLIRQTGTEEQKRTLFAAVLSGLRLGNAFSEYKGKNVEDFATRIVRQGDSYVVNGEKFYSTGALFSHLVPIVALTDDGKVLCAIADRETPGLTIIDDWSSFGQRTTASGTVLLKDVVVPAERVLEAYIAYDRPSTAGPQSQILHASIDVGLARGIIEKTIQFVRESARPWIDSGVEKASQDPYTIAEIGDLKIRLHAAEALLERAARITDRAIADPQADGITSAKVAVAEAKVLTTEIALLAANKLFELSGTRSTLGVHNLDRLWRDVRAHTLHDPVRWKPHAVGNYYLNGINPPLHSWI